MPNHSIHIDLSLPRSWDQCTTEQLETIAACIMAHTAMADRFHPFDWEKVKSELFLLLAEIEIISTDTNPDDPEDTIYLCRKGRPDGSRPSSGGSSTPPRHSFLRRPWFRHGSKTPEFRLRPWQVQYWIDTQLKWLDDEKSTLIFFPYTHLIHIRHWQWKWPFIKKTYYTPSELLQDFTWQQYRHLQDYMSMYIDIQNALVPLLSKSSSRTSTSSSSSSGRSRTDAPADLSHIAQLQAEMTAARNEFLYILFSPNSPSASPSDTPSSGRSRTDALYIRKKVARITEVQWQVILLWWSGMMHYLKDHYPRCFRSSSSKKKSKNPPNPLELYTSIVATMQKYIGIDEEKINNQTFHVILEQLERIAKENEEIEKINRKHK